jgi:hypothetical protein
MHDLDPQEILLGLLVRHRPDLLEVLLGHFKGPLVRPINHLDRVLLDSPDLETVEDRYDNQEVQGILDPNKCM